MVITLVPKTARGREVRDRQAGTLTYSLLSPKQRFTYANCLPLLHLSLRGKHWELLGLTLSSQSF